MAGELRKAGMKPALPASHFKFSRSCWERPGEVVTREELQKRLWPDTFVVILTTT